MSITLTDVEDEMAWAAAKLRADESAWAGRSQAHGFGGGYGSLDIQGARGELALVVHYRDHYQERLVWSIHCNATSEELKNGGDVGGMHVRSTHHKSGRLIYRPGEPLGRYVLAVVEHRTVTLPGYFDVLDPELLSEQWLTDFGTGREEVWGIPQDALVVWP